MQTPLAITRVCLESKGSLQISWLALACASMKKPNIFKGTNKTLRNMFQSRGSVSFPLWGKGYGRSWNSWNSLWRGWCHTAWDVGTPNHRATAAMLSTQHQRDATQRRLTKEVWRNASSSASQRHVSCFKGCSRWEIHTGGKTYRKVTKENKSSSAARFTSLMTILACWAVVEVGILQRSSSSSYSQQKEVRQWAPSNLYENLAWLFKKIPIFAME